MKDFSGFLCVEADAQRYCGPEAWTLGARNESQGKGRFGEKEVGRKGNWGSSPVGTVLFQYHSSFLSTAWTRCAEASLILSTWEVEIEGSDTQCHPSATQLVQGYLPCLKGRRGGERNIFYRHTDI